MSETQEDLTLTFAEIQRERTKNRVCLLRQKVDEGPHRGTSQGALDFERIQDTLRHIDAFTYKGTFIRRKN